ncbi:MAG: ketoacyl-ACP synthase III [Planctomycetes bacterium]|nr:ketoacyl-ACP synthase III [Planctomycetota bacterium]
MISKGVRFAGTGSYLPERVVTNDDLSKTLDTNDEWIRTRTGISERRFAAPEQAASDLGIAAARRALDAAGVAPADLDLIICATMTNDYVIPSTAALIQRALGAERAGGFDLCSACSGFVLSLGAASGYIKTGAAKNVLVLGAEKMSVAMDMQDRTTAVIFADGAGAAVLQPSPEPGSDVLALRQGLKGDVDVLSIPAGGSRRPTSVETVQNREHYIKMAGRETFKFAVKTFSSLIEGTCADAGVTTSDLKVIVPHQVNQRIIEAACERSQIDMSRCVINIDRVGNTSAASVAIALDEAVRAGRIERGDLVLLVAFGAGLSWASALVRW